MAKFSEMKKDASANVDVEIDNQKKCDWVPYVGAFIFTFIVAVITAPRGLIH